MTEKAYTLCLNAVARVINLVTRLRAMVDRLLTPRLSPRGRRRA